MTRYDLLVRKVRAEFPELAIVPRKGTWLGLFFGLMTKLTGANYDHMVTTIGSTIYVGDSWANRTDDGKYKTLRHELIHIRQFHGWPFGYHWPRINHALFSIFYLLVLPALWTYRARFEREAYTQTLLVDRELHGPISDLDMELNAEAMVLRFTGPQYLWMSRRQKTYRWAMETQRKINLGTIENPIDQVGDSEVMVNLPA